ncbi:MAG: hypothetical protein JO307_00990, partial [Bryobacterales bacterium]|nr:hypothetical protein [Bryobacterales bacterium]
MQLQRYTTRRRSILAILPLALLVMRPSPAGAYDHDPDGFVYVMSNAAEGNAILVYSR